jgi:hypothetical protein
MLAGVSAFFKEIRIERPPSEGSASTTMFRGADSGIGERKHGCRKWIAQRRKGQFAVKRCSLVDDGEAFERKLSGQHAQALGYARVHRNKRVVLGGKPAHQIDAGRRCFLGQRHDIARIFQQCSGSRVRLLQTPFEHAGHHGDGLQRSGHVVADDRREPPQECVTRRFCQTHL